LEDKEVSSEQRVSSEGVPQIRSSVADLKTYLCDTCGSILKDILCLAGYQGERARHKPYYCGACGRQFWFNTPIRQCWKQPSGQKFFRREEGRDSAKTCRGHVLEKTYTHGEGGMGFLITFGFPQHQAPPSRMQVHENTELGEDFHSGQRHHECSECGKVFTYRNTLARHQRVHTGEKLYECCECGKFFRQSYDLFKHQTVHTGEKLYQCSKCGKFFSSKSNLIRHQEVHTGARPYECSECGKAFTQRPNLI
jgi:KRAB domain-containing zinc finger protein